MKNNFEDLALRLQGVIDTAIDGIITIDALGIVETVNFAASEQFEYIPSEIIGNNIKMLMPQPYHGEHDGYLKNYQQTRKAQIIGIGREVVGRKKSGELFPFRLAVSEVVLNNRIIYTGIIHDLSDVKNAEKELLKLNISLKQKVEKRTEELEDTVGRLLKTNNELEEKKKALDSALKKEQDLNELKSLFVTIASHEFRTPLSIILSSASLISKYPDASQQDKRAKHIERIKLAVNNLTSILNDFLTLSKIEERKIEIGKDTINFKEFFKDVCLSLEGILKTDQVFNIENVGTFQIAISAKILTNILFNLLSNAIKYSAEKQQIHCSAIIQNEHLEISIRDEGIGIPPSEMKYLFDRFFRASNSENIQGTGLGLTIIKKYCEQLNGTVEVESELGIGTTFTIKIPIQ